MSNVKVFLAALAVTFLAGASPSISAETGGMVTVPVSEYQRLKDIAESKGKNQYWNMTFEQILEKRNGNQKDAWELYRYYVLRTLDLDGTVADGNVSDIIRDINILGEINSDKPITLVIDSPGGSVLAGYNLMNAIYASKAPIYTVCDGWAMSMAAVILTLGDYRVANEGCIWMTHEVAAGSPGGKSGEQLAWADHLLSVEEILLKAMSKKTGLSTEDLLRLGEYETFYSGEELPRLGIVDAYAPGTSTTVMSRSIPEDLLPANRMKANFSRKINSR